MRHIKTIKHYVGGSDKYFDIFECVVDEVNVDRDMKGRRSITIKVGDKEYKGLWNKSVQDHLTEFEGKPSFIVLWKSPKGNHMLAYSWELWSRHLTGEEQGEVKELVNQEETGPAFLYMWVDRSNDMKYIGYHVGTLNDGYVCSSDLMMAEFEKRPDDFFRTILAWGTKDQMYELETLILLELGAATRGPFYNISNNLR